MPETAEATSTESPAESEALEESASALALAESQQTTSDKPQQATQPARDADADLTADYDKWRKTEKTPDSPGEATETAEDRTTEGQATDKGKPAPATKPTDALADLTPEDVTLLKRRHIDQRFVPKDPVERQQFLREQERAQAELDRFFTARRNGQEPEQPESPEQTTQQTDPTAKPAPDLDKLWTELTDGLFTDNGPQRLRETIEQTIAARVEAGLAERLAQFQPLQQNVAQLVQNRAQEQFRSALADWTPPAGVDAQDAEVIKKIDAKAVQFINVELAQGKTLPQIDVRQHTLDAALVVFPQKQQAAEQQRRSDVARRGVRGSPESGTRAPTTRPARTEDELERDWFANNPRK